MLKTKCAVCGCELIECGEFDGDNEHEIVVNLLCPNCGAEVFYTIDMSAKHTIYGEEQTS